MIVGSYFKPATKLKETLSHSGNANTHFYEFVILVGLLLSR